MLRRLGVAGEWRSLDPRSWPSDVPFGRRTVVYGHNGSGKSTLAELLLSVAEGTCATEAVWEDEHGARSVIQEGEKGPPTRIAVFTRRWVEANLADFLDGESASAIVTLGREAIDAKEEEQRLTAEIEDLRIQAREAEKQRTAADRRVRKLTQDVQDRIVSELKPFDYNHFTKSRYSVPKVQDLLRSYKGEYPDTDAHAEALGRLVEGELVRVSPMPPPPTGAATELEALSGVLSATPARVALDELAGNPQVQRWVEEGFELHGDHDNCMFCSARITEERRAQLAAHFDESWRRIRSEASRLLDVASLEKHHLEAWTRDLPPASSLSSDLQAVYESGAAHTRAEVAGRVRALEKVVDVLNLKVADPSVTPDGPDWSVLASPPTTTVLAEAVDAHNDRARRQQEIAAERRQVVLDHLIGSRSREFRDLAAHAESCVEEASTSQQSVRLAERRLEEVRQARFTTKDMADTLTKDLARVYGKHHLSVAVTEDGKSYSCRRGDDPATDLSDGERTTLSLLYFLRKLEDEQASSGNPSERVVVVDDPSSSLDREALYATHQWLFDTLRSFGQYVVLTHDFSLLRLFLKSHKSAWGSSMRRIAQGDADESIFPGVCFREMYAASVDGERRSRLGELPRLLLNNTSEYAYLFSMVMAGVLDSSDHERLFLLPNASRRVLEVFASYKAPHRPDFLQQLEILVQSQEGEPFRDVYDFCNRYSHGEGSESIDVLDARAVHGQIRRCMEFLKSIDPEHYERMCEAAAIDSTQVA
ncbi:MAG: AAA family ATPase [Actinomycetota bacterium]